MLIVTAIMHQNWHHLLFLHWEIPAQELQEMVPPELTIDTFEGKAYVGLIPFTLSGVRPTLTPPVPWLSSFHEVNVRTYVHHRGANPGVWFFSLDTSSALAVEGARAFYKLPYFHARMDFSDGADFRLDSRRDDPAGAQPADLRVRYLPADGVVTHATPGTLAHFLIERYILYSMDKEHQLYRARVHHQPYPVQRAEVLELEETLVWAAGIKRSEAMPLRHYAREVNVKIDPLEKC
jgi:uncharacterized protein YqjF (DUF2071 family)